jgi:hypothetical protein
MEEFVIGNILVHRIKIAVSAASYGLVCVLATHPVFSYIQQNNKPLAF